EPVRDCEGIVVDNLDEASGISLGRNIDRSIGASRCDEYERCMSNEPSTMVIDGVDNLCRAEGMSNDGADFVFARDNVPEALLEYREFAAHEPPLPKRKRSTTS